ncbi:MAG: DegT/DnrJ/EryC1/StrS family aminotransferase, partial [Dehalococcoidia bacterium]|nr:DegT/DnrJ/EryC1/StrS family aminotransferase [Dehalococcoidia bacterium]
VVACNSGTMALQAALHALALRKGGEVITTPYTFSATTAAIVHAGLVPVFADVDEWGCLDPDSVRRVETAEMVAVLPVDLFGRVVGHRFVGGNVIEDACQAVGAFLPPARGGSSPSLAASRYGTVGAWSFNGAKNVPAGEAGALVTSDDRLAERARRYVSHGENWGYEVGLNGRINELTACVAYHGLRSVLANNARRRELARILRWSLSGRTDLALPDEDGHALYVYPNVLAEDVDRAAFVKGMRARGIEVGEGYIRPPLHQYPAFRKYQRIPLPMVEALSERRLCLLSQVRPPATIEDMRYLADSIAAVLDGRAGRLPRRRVGHIRDSVF